MSLFISGYFKFWWTKLSKSHRVNKWMLKTKQNKKTRPKFSCREWIHFILKVVNNWQWKYEARYFKYIENKWKQWQPHLDEIDVKSKTARKKEGGQEDHYIIIKHFILKRGNNIYKYKCTHREHWIHKENNRKTKG